MSVVFFFFFKQKTAYELRISDWSSDVCSSDLRHSSRWKDRKPDGKWEGRRHSDKSRWSGKDRAEARERWRERSTEAEVKRVPSRIERRHMNQSRPGFQGRPPRAERSKDRPYRSDELPEGKRGVSKGGSRG